jgi:hypothetical protein
MLKSLILIPGTAKKGRSIRSTYLRGTEANDIYRDNTVLWLFNIQFLHFKNGTSN